MGPGLLPAGYAPYVRNFLTHDVGKMTMRGCVPSDTYNIGTGDVLTGAWAFNDKLLLGTVDKTSGLYPYWIQNWKKAPSAGDISQATTNLVHLDTATGVRTPITAGTIYSAPSGRGARLGDYVWGFAYSTFGLTNLQNGGYVGTLRFMYRWDGTAAEPTVWANAPVSGQDIIAHLNRLWVAGARATVDAAPPAYTEPNVLFFSDDGGPVNNLATDWRDDVSGLTNRITVGSKNDNDFIVGMEIVNQNLVVFKRHSIWIIYGYSPETFQVRRLTAERGCLDRRSICAADGGVYFCSQYGVEFYDGSEFTTLDNNIADMTRPFMNVMSGSANRSQNFATFSIGLLNNNYLMVCLGAQDYDSSLWGKDLTSDSGFGSAMTWLYHRPSGNWSLFTSDALNVANRPVEVISQVVDRPLIFDGQDLREAQLITDPERGYIMGFGQRDQTTTGTNKIIPAKIVSDRYPLASPGYRAQLHRFLMDYTFPNNADDDAAYDGWYVSLATGSGDTLLTERQVAGQGFYATNFLNGPRYRADVFTEAVDCQLTIEWKGSDDIGEFPRGAELYDAAIEIQTTRQREST